MRVQIDFKMATDGVQSYHYRGFGILQENTLRFIDHQKDHYEFYFPNRLNATMKRLGQSPLSMTFMRRKSSPAQITQEGFTLSLDVYTKELNVEENHLNIIYQITDGKSIFSNHHLSIDWNYQWKE